MGGKGSGGRRAGSGRKRRTALEHEIKGTRARVLAHPSAAAVPELPPVEEFDAPNELTTEERKVWLELAPFGFANGTLVKATSLSFRMLCRNIVLERSFHGGSDQGKADHRGLIQRVDAELLRFNLSPCGKPMYRTVTAKPDASPANPLRKFLKR